MKLMKIGENYRIFLIDEWGRITIGNSMQGEEVKGLDR